MSGGIFGVLLWTCLPLGVMLAVVLVLGSVPRCGETPAEAGCKIQHLMEEAGRHYQGSNLMPEGSAGSLQDSWLELREVHQALVPSLQKVWEVWSEP